MPLPVVALPRGAQRELLALDKRLRRPGQSAADHRIELDAHLAEGARDVRGLAPHVRQLAHELAEPLVRLGVHVDSMLRKQELKHVAAVHDALADVLLERELA